MKLRKLFFWLHLCAGIVAGVVILIMSITGVALTFQKQMTEWADRGYWPPPPEPGAASLPLESLIDTAGGIDASATPSAVVLYSDVQAPVTVTVAGKNLMVNSYSGQIVGEGSKSIRQFFSVMTTWHRYLGAGTEGRPLGKAITGACNLVFLFIVASGFYLWWPRTWTVQALRSITFFKRGQRGRARDFNWHNVFGFWAAVPLFLVVLSATVISYPWATNLVYRIAGSGPPTPVARQTPAAQPGAPDRRQPVVDLNGIDAIVAQAKQQVPNWRTMNLRLPALEDKEVTITVDEGWGGQPQRRSTLTMDRVSGSVVRMQTFADQNLGQRARSWLRFVHTGEFYGIPGQTVAGIASFAGVMLVFTGLSLAVRRFLAWLGRRSRSAPVPNMSPVHQQTYLER